MEHSPQQTAMEHVRNHRLGVMIGGSVIISILLVLVALALYASSGAEQLDLSRPGYAAIRDQIHDDDSYQGFSPAGNIDKAALEQFSQLYKEKLKEATSVDAFGEDVLSPKALQIDQKSAEKD